jgi:hypothetical protein
MATGGPDRLTGCDARGADAPGLSSAPVIWPNAESAANSDPWLVAHHDELTLMRPRVLALNFVHGQAEPEARAQLTALCAALRESSRWHGFRDPGAPPFLEYELVGIEDLTEPAGRVDRNSARFPRAPDGAGLDYAALFALLPLEDLVARGAIHELWLLADHTERTAPWETVEVKQAYDAAFRPAGVAFDAGNSGPHSAPWIGRSLRILFVNFARGTGCAMESLGHSLERMATCGAIPYYERYFREFAMLDLDRRHGLPFESLYVKGPHPVDYPAPATLRYRAGWRRRTVEDYVPAGGNVHFMPNGRFDYDLDNPAPVLSTIESWRTPDEAPRPWSPAALDRYRDLAPDCMGRWVVYWRQAMPGLGNTARDDDGRPMKNWWPFLFY